MRKLMWFAVGFVTACGIGAYILRGFGYIYLATLGLLAGVAMLLVKKKQWKIIGVILLGVGLGFGWLQGYEMLYLQSAHDYDTQTVYAAVEVSEYGRPTYYGVAVDGTIRIEGMTYPIRLYVNDTQSLSPGDVVEGTIELRLTANGGSAESTNFLSDGIVFLGYVQDGAQISIAQEVPVRYYPAFLRKNILAFMDRLFPADTLAFARALLLGDSDGLSYEMDTAFKTSGIRHVVAVSGLHVAILFSVIYILAGKRRFLTALLGLPVLFLFAAVAGFSPSVVRACIMQGLMILALLFNREYDPPTALAAAVLVILMNNPSAIYSPGLQLSAGCMIGMFLFCSKIRAFLLKGKLGSYVGKKGIRGWAVRWSTTCIAVTLSTMLFTTPLCAYYFGMVSLVGVVTNLLTLWMISGIFYGLILSCLLGFVWLPAGCFVAQCISWPIRLVQLVANGLSCLPIAAVYTCSDYIVIWIAVSYVLIGWFFLCKKKKPVLTALGIVVSLAACIGMSWVEPVVGNYLVTVIDVGQGQSVLLRCGGANFLVDCGGPNGRQTADQTAQLLLSQGITSLDGIIVTHYDSDHVGAVELLMRRIYTVTLYLPDVSDETGYKESLANGFADRIHWVENDTVLRCLDSQIHIYTADAGKTGNEGSLCVLFQRQNCDILITGDRGTGAEAALLEKTVLPDLELLVAGHHGASSSTGLPLLFATRPDVVAISVGAENTYGHPASEVLERLRLFGCEVRRTDLDGTINFRR